MIAKHDHEQQIGQAWDPEFQGEFLVIASHLLIDI